MKEITLQRISDGKFASPAIRSVVFGWKGKSYNKNPSDIFKDRTYFDKNLKEQVYYRDTCRIVKYKLEVCSHEYLELK